MKPLQLVCFGPPTVLLDGRPAAPDVVWRKHLALLAYLSLSPDRTRTRTHLVGLLWPEKTADAARHSLNEAVRRLRADIGTDRLVSEGELVRLASDGLEVDACRFEEEAADCEAAARLLRGDFLEGLALEDAPPFEEWLGLQRARYRSRGAEVLVACGERRLTASRFAEAQDAGLRALNLEPFAEPPVRLLMRAAALSGDVAGALAHFREHEATLAAQLQETPSRELTALRDRIRQQRSAFSAPAPEERDAPLVGRAAAHRAAFALVLEGTVRGPRALIVSGDPGMGRSRLLAECERRMALEGAVVARARPIESDEDVPWSTLGQLLRDGLLRAPGMAAADPDALAVLASLEPTLAERVAPRPARDTAHVAAALASLLAAVADEQPLALVVDDGHFADPRTLEALDAALARLGDARVTLVVAVAATATAASRELLRLQGHVGAGLPGLSVRLDPLDVAAVGELVAAMADWCGGERRDRLARRIAVESGGSPFLAVTLLRGLRRDSAIREALTAWPPPNRTLTAPLPISVPHLVRSAVLLQVGQLDESARRVLQAWSVAGPVWDPELVTALSGLLPGDVEEGLAALERQRFVDLAGDRYVFVSPLVPEVVRTECLTKGRVRSLRAAAIAHLAPRGDLESRVLHAELLAANEPGPPTFEAALTVARDALASGSRRRAARALAAARRALGHETPEPDALRALDAQLRGEAHGLALSGRAPRHRLIPMHSLNIVSASQPAQGPRYEERMVAPMREELVRVGFVETRTAAEVDAQLKGLAGSALVVVNSVCGCAAGRARPAVVLALSGAPVRPDKLLTVFAGNDVEATARAREYFPGYGPSSPQMGLIKDGALVFMLERRDIEGREAPEIAADLTAAFQKWCGAQWWKAAE